MTMPEAVPVTLSPGMVRHILGLLATAEAMLCVLKARGEEGDSRIRASLEEISAHLTGGHDTGDLICLLKQARRDLESRCPARPPTGRYHLGYTKIGIPQYRAELDDMSARCALAAGPETGRSPAAR